MNIKIIKAAVVGLVLSISGFANAGLIVQTEIKSPTNFFDTIEFDVFDTNLGTLTAVWLDLDLSITNYHVDSSGLCTTFSDCAADSYLNIIGNVGFFGSSWTDSQFVTDSQVDNGIYVNLAILELAISFTNISDFETGNLNPMLSILSGKSNCCGTIQSNQLGYATLSYEYTAVPEPTTLAIFALGIMGLASRRFKKQ